MSDFKTSELRDTSHELLELRAKLKEAELAEARAKTRAMRLEMALTDTEALELGTSERLEKTMAQLKEAQEAAEFNFQQYQDAGRLLCEARAEIERLRTGFDRFIRSCEECTDQDGWLAFMCSVDDFHEAQAVLEEGVNDET